MSRFHPRNSDPSATFSHLAPPLTDSCPLSLLTHNIKLVGVINAPILILHDAGVVALVRRHHRVHYDAPGGIANLWGTDQGALLRVWWEGQMRATAHTASAAL